MDAIIISDVHLGSANCQAKDLCSFLQDIEAGIIQTKELIINGDLFDSLEFRRLKKNHWKVLSLIRKLSDQIRVIWVKGNHDEGAIETVSHLIGAEICDQYAINEILVIHGDRFDRFITKYPYTTWIADCFYQLLQKISINLARLIKRRSKTFLRCTEIIKEKSLVFAKENGFSSVCVGHTHFAVSEKNYHNSGCWTESPTYLIVKDGKVTLQHYLNNRSNY